jgi:hypothetical protein
MQRSARLKVMVTTFGTKSLAASDAGGRKEVRKGPVTREDKIFEQQRKNAGRSEQPSDDAAAPSI